VYAGIRTTYPANFIETTDRPMIQQTQQFFSSEPAVVHINWKFANNKSNFAQLFINSSIVSVINVSCLHFTQYLNRVFRMSTSCSNKRSNYVAKWYDCLINEDNKQTLAANPSISSTKESFSSEMLVIFGVFQRCAPYMIIHWHIYLVYFMLFLHQYLSLITYSLRKKIT